MKLQTQNVKGLESTESKYQCFYNNSEIHESNCCAETNSEIRFGFTANAKIQLMLNGESVHNTPPCDQCKEERWRMRMTMRLYSNEDTFNVRQRSEQIYHVYSIQPTSA